MLHEHLVTRHSADNFPKIEFAPPRFVIFPRRPRSGQSVEFATRRIRLLSWNTTTSKRFKRISLTKSFVSWINSILGKFVLYPMYKVSKDISYDAKNKSVISPFEYCVRTRQIYQWRSKQVKLEIRYSNVRARWLKKKKKKVRSGKKRVLKRGGYIYLHGYFRFSLLVKAGSSV